MATFTHGSSARLLVNGRDLSSYFKTATVAKSCDVHDTTAFSSTAKTYIPGLPDATLSAEGMHDGSPEAAGTVLHSALAVDYTVISLYPAGTATGAWGQGLYGTENSVEIASPVDGVVSLAFGAQSTNGAERILAHASKTSGTVGGTATVVDNSAQSTAGWAAYAHAQGTATDLTLVVEDSADNSAFTAVGTVYTGAVTGGTAARYQATGNLRRYVRIVDTITAGTVTWQVGISRTPLL